MMNVEAKIAGAGPGIAEIDEEAEFSPSDTASRRKLYGAIALGLLGLLAVIWYFHGRSSGEEVAPAAPAVTVITVPQGIVSRNIGATGTIGARHDIAVSATGEGGQIASVLVEAGQWVRKGQILAIIDRAVQTQQAAALRAQVGVARADLNLAQAELDRAAKLIDRGFISKADVDRKTAARDSARAQVKAAQASVGEAEARTARLNIVAPVAGLILERMAEPGQTVTQGSGTLFRMAQDGEFEVAANLSESDLALVSVGTPATITPTGTDVRITGRIWQVSPVIDPQSRQGVARIALPFNPALRPGGFASANISAGTVTAAVLPESAVLNDRQGTYVYVIDKDDKVRRRAVETGITTADGIAVRSGISGNDRIVARAGSFLNPGETVRPRMEKATAARP